MLSRSRSRSRRLGTFAVSKHRDFFSRLSSLFSGFFQFFFDFFRIFSAKNQFDPATSCTCSRFLWHFSVALAFVFSHFRSVHQSFYHKLNVDLKMAIFHLKNWGGQDSVSVSKFRDPVSPDSKSRDQNISRL